MMCQLWYVHLQQPRYFVTIGTIVYTVIHTHIGFVVGKCPHVVVVNSNMWTRVVGRFLLHHEVRMAHLIGLDILHTLRTIALVEGYTKTTPHTFFKHMISLSKIGNESM